jgi:hypothetical protein
MERARRTVAEFWETQGHFRAPALRSGRIWPSFRVARFFIALTDVWEHELRHFLLASLRNTRKST